MSEDQRKLGAGLMHTGYYFGFFFASVANYFIGANYGWRWMFIFGGFPALLIGFIRYGVRESTKWQERFSDETRARPAMRDAIATIFSPRYVRADNGHVGAVPHLDHRTLGRVDLRADGHDAMAVRGGASARRRCAPASYGGMVLAHWNDRRLCRGAAHRRAYRPAESDGHLFRPHGGQHPHRVRLRVLSAGVGHLTGSTGASSCSGWAAPTSRCIRCGCRSSPRRIAAPARSRSSARSAASSAWRWCFSSARASGPTAASASPWP